MSLHSRWKEEVGHIHERCPELKPGTTRILAAHRILGPFARITFQSHLRRRRMMTLLQHRQHASVESWMHARQRAYECRDADPETYRILSEIVQLRAEQCRQCGIDIGAWEGSPSDAKNAILEGDAHHSPRSGPRSDGNLP